MTLFSKSLYRTHVRRIGHRKTRDEKCANDTTRYAYKHTTLHPYTRNVHRAVKFASRTPRQPARPRSSDTGYPQTAARNPAPKPRSETRPGERKAKTRIPARKGRYPRSFRSDGFRPAGKRLYRFRNVVLPFPPAARTDSV